MSEQPNNQNQDLLSDETEDVEGHRHGKDRKRADFISDRERKRADLLADEDVEGHRWHHGGNVQPPRDEDLGGSDR